MKKLINGLLYSILLAVTAAGTAGVAHFIVQEQGRVELEAQQRRLAEAERAKEEAERARQEEAQRNENLRAVVVKELPVYQKKNITKIKAGRTQLLSYGDEVTVLQEDGLYTKIRTEQDDIGYVWSDCIGIRTDGQPPAAEPKVVVLDVNLSAQKQDDTGQAEEADALCLSLAAGLETVLEARGLETVLTARAGEGVSSSAKRAELANQIQADVMLQICLGSASSDAKNESGEAGGRDSEAADGGADSSDAAVRNQGTDGSTDTADDKAGSAAAYIAAPDSQHPAAKRSADSKKLGKKIIKYYTKQTGIKNGGITESEDTVSINQSKMSAVMLRLGDLSDSTQYKKMKKETFQAKMIQGIADGIEAYLGSEGAQ